MEPSHFVPKHTPAAPSFQVLLELLQDEGAQFQMPRVARDVAGSAADKLWYDFSAPENEEY